MKLNAGSLADVQLGTPLLAEGPYFVRIKSDGVKVEPNKDKTGNVLKLALQVLNETVNDYEENKELDNSKRFMTLWTNISLLPTFNDDGTPKYDPAVRLKELGLAIGLPKDFDDLETTDLQGACMKVMLQHRPAEGGYSAQNVVNRYLPIEETDNFEEPAFG
jgi:hypothetical protein